MAETKEFFETWLPEKLRDHPTLAKDINAVYVFDIDGAGQWTVDLTSGSGEVRPGAHPDPGCTVSAAKGDFESMLENPSSAMMMFMGGKLKVSNVGLGLSLQKLLG